MMRIHEGRLMEEEFDLFARGLLVSGCMIFEGH
jgi:hypothetical protein